MGHYTILGYSRLYAITIKDGYQILKTEKCLDSSSNAVIDLTFGENSGCTQIEIGDCDKVQKAFTSHHGLYRLLQIPICLMNTVSAFSRTKDIIFSTMQRQFVLDNFFDVIIFSKSIQGHQHLLQTLLALLSRAGLSLKPKKCFVFDDPIHYFGPVIQSGRPSISTRTTDEICVLQRCTYVSKLKSFLVICNAFRLGVPSFLGIPPVEPKVGKGRAFAIFTTQHD